MRKHAPNYLRYRYAQISGRTYWEVVIDGVSCKFGFATPYHYLYGRRLHLGEHERTLLSVWKKQVEFAGDGFIADLGGYNGVYGLLAGCANPNADVYIFEADAINVAQIKQNIKLNNLTKVTVVHAAVSDQDGHVVFQEHKGGSGGRIVEGQTGMSVSSINFGRWLQENNYSPRLLKFDIVGAEDKALRSMEEILVKTSSLAILLEYYPHALHGAKEEDIQFGSWLQKLGFTSLYLYPRSDGQSIYYFVFKGALVTLGS